MGLSGSPWEGCPLGTGCHSQWGPSGHDVPPCSQACAGCARDIAISAVGSHAPGRTLGLWLCADSPGQWWHAGIGCWIRWYCASLQQSTSMPRKNASMWNTLPIDMSSVSVPETVGGRPRCSTMNQTSSVLLPCDEGHRLRLSHHTGVWLPNTRKSARSRGQ